VVLSLGYWGEESTIALVVIGVPGARWTSTVRTLPTPVNRDGDYHSG